MGVFKAQTRAQQRARARDTRVPTRMCTPPPPAAPSASTYGATPTRCKPALLPGPAVTNDHTGSSEQRTPISTARARRRPVCPPGAGADAAPCPSRLLGAPSALSLWPHHSNIRLRGHRASPRPLHLHLHSPCFQTTTELLPYLRSPKCKPLSISRPPAVPISTEHLSRARRQGWGHSGEQSKQMPHLLEPKVQWADGPQPSQQPVGHGRGPEGASSSPRPSPHGSRLELSFTHAHCLRLKPSP